MTPLRILSSPELQDATLIAAFAGWSDAGGAATAAAQYLIERWRAVRLAEIDAEEFYDFTQLRPTTRYEGDVRRIDWPENSFHHHHSPGRPSAGSGQAPSAGSGQAPSAGSGRDLVIFNGIEPHLRWKTYTQALLEAIDRFQVKLVVTLGALNADYPHTRPLRTTGMAPDPQMAARAGLRTRGRRYEGPTGINGVLGATLAERGVPAATVWVNVPHYVNATPNPSATLALLKAVAAMLEVDVPLGRMVRAATAFDAQLNEATAKNTEVSDYVRSLEERFDAESETLPGPPPELPATETIVKDIEEFLRRSAREE